MSRPAIRTLLLASLVTAASGCGSSHCPSSTTPVSAAAASRDTMPTALATRSTRQTHLDAAKTLVLTTVSEETWNALVRTMTDAVVSANADFRPLRPAFDQFFAQYVTRDEVATRIAPLYVERFTELELRQMIWFYSTDTGKKALVELPGLMEAGGDVGRQIVQDHSADLQRILADYVAHHPAAAPRRSR